MIILNKTNFQVKRNQNPYELWYGKPPTIKYFRFFGRKYFVKRTDEKHGTFEPRANEQILLGYSSRIK